LQEETAKDTPKREYKRNDPGSRFRYSNKSRSFPFNNSNNAQVAAKGFDGEPNLTKRSNDNSRSSQSKDKAATLMAYRKAKGLCYKCGMKWNPGHKCSNSVLYMW
jgi:hypothetical protein